MAALIRARAIESIDVNAARVLCATAVPGAEWIVAATDANELVCGGQARATTASFARGIASARYTFLGEDSLPEEKQVILVLTDGGGLSTYSYPTLEKLGGEASNELAEISKNAQTFSVDSLGSNLVSESFRVALAVQDKVLLADINQSREKVTVLGEHTPCAGERILTVAFSEMTIVASTAKLHYLLRISRGRGLAVAATVKRFEQSRRKATASAVGDGGTAVMSFFGGLFRRKDLYGNIVPPAAFALPANRWLLVVDNELVTYSSFGAKLEEMENVFKSRSGMEFTDTRSIGRNSSGEKLSSMRQGSIVQSASASSLASVGTTVSRMTLLDESQAKRSEKPTLSTTYSCPFVLSVTEANEVLAFAANGSVQGVIEQLKLIDENSELESGVKIIPSRSGRSLATAFWPSGRAMAIELVDNLDALIEQREVEKELRLALALVPSDQIDRMIGLRRMLAIEARAEEWHDAAIIHMQSVFNLSVKREGVDQLDLIAEAVELRGPRNSGWQTDAVTATLWADFLFRLRRRVMQPSAADVDVLETLCRADESSTRVKAILSVKHDIPLNTGESVIASSQSVLREEERVEALVALYTSLSEHGKALLLIENSEVTHSFDGVVGYLCDSMRPSDDPDVYFAHLKWLAHRSHEEAQGRLKLDQVIANIGTDARNSPTLLGQTFEVLVEEAEDQIEAVIENISSSESQSSNVESAATTDSVSGDALASALLAGMAKADELGKRNVFSRLRALFGSRVLHDPQASYHSYTLLQALQTPKIKALGLHEESAFLLGRQGRHEAAADELASERALPAEEALRRLTKMLPASDRSSAADSLAAAYLRVSSQGSTNRISDASELLRCGAGNMEIEKLLLDGRCSDDALSLSDMRPLLQAALVSGNERLRTAEIVRALRKSEVRRVREEVFSLRRRCVVVGHDRACALCTRRLGDSVFSSYPDGSVAHLACHMSKDSREGLT